MMSVKNQMVEDYFNCNNTTNCDLCTLNNSFVINGEKIMYCVLLSEFSEEIFRRLKEKLTE